MELNELKNIISNCEIIDEKIFVKSNIHNVIELLKNKFSYNMLKSITAIDLEDEIEILYNLYSVEDREEAIISTKIKGETESISDLYDSAKADENEIFDMFGINFLGNNDLKRLYMPENWKGFPLKKDYVQDDTRLAWNDDSKNA